MVTTQLTINAESIMEQLKGQQQKMQKAIDLTIKDCKARAPAQITKAVTAVYGIKSNEVTAAGKTAKTSAQTIGAYKVAAGVEGKTLQLTYEGRLLTPVHFSMTPKKRPEGKKKYTVKVAIFKGKKKALQGKPKYGTPVFLAPQQTGVVLPFQREGKSRMPVQVIRTLGIPQMITNETVAADIQEKTSELYLTRLQHHVDVLNK